MTTAPERLLVLSHTHWDREWYHTVDRFRLRLVPLVDAVLDRDEPAGARFLLDGQAIVLRDYLALRPERQPQLAAALRSGRIEAGPWFVLADNLIPSGEAIVRNLQAGARTLSRLGAAPPPVAYCPDSFGHPGMLPAIASGFGLGVGIVWRGVGGSRHPRANTLRWNAPDGSTLLVHHLPPDGYEFGATLPRDAAGAGTRWARMLAILAERSNVAVALIPNGADHHALQPDLPDALMAARQWGETHGVTVDATSLRDFAATLTSVARGRTLPAISGELRDSYGYTWTLQGTFATRAHQKRRNARLERALLRDVEPWMALARLLPASTKDSGNARSGAVTRSLHRPLLSHVWERLLETHPHDTLCGCSRDEVALAMDDRQRAVASMIPELRRNALASLLGIDPIAARSAPPAATPCVIVRNRSARARAGLATVELIEQVRDTPVGPGSASAATNDVPPRTLDELLPGCRVQRISTRVVHDRRESPQHYPDSDLVRTHRLLVEVEEVPALGACIAGGQGIAAASHGDVRITAVRADEHDSYTMENGQVELRVSHAGVTVVTDGGHPLTLRLESIDDLGDSYTPSLRGAPRVLRIDRVRRFASGPLRGAVDVTFGATRTSTRRKTGPRAARGVERVRVLVRLSLDANSPTVRCSIAIDNRMRNHRLQLAWITTDIDGEPVVHADAAFGPVRREPTVAPAGSAETPPSTMPLHRWLAASYHGTTDVLLSDGLAEGEATAGRLAVTLLRAIGALSRSDIPERPGHAGWPTDTPRAQCLGRTRAEIGITQIARGWSRATLEEIERRAEDVLLPLTGDTWRDLDRSSPPATWRGLALEGEGLVLSSCTLSELDEASVTLRAVNVLDDAVDGAWILPDDGPWEVTPCRLDETPRGSAMHYEGARIPIALTARALATIRVRRVVR